MRIIQRRLNDLGYGTLTIDGQEGVTTEAKIKAYQQAKGYTSDGIVGSTTFSAMLPTIRLGSAENAVTFLRAQLTRKGYAGGGTSSTFDGLLQSVVLSFQTNNGLTADGIVGPNTWRLLGP